MNLFKKLVFVPFFISAVIAAVVLGNQIVVDPLNQIFSLQADQFLGLLYLSASLLLAGLFFAIIVTLAASWEIPLVSGFLAAIIPLMIIPQSPANMLVAGGFLGSFVIGQMFLLQRLKNYFNFSAGNLLSPGIRITVLCLTLGLSLVAYQTADSKIKRDGFTIPDALINIAISLSGAQTMEVGETNNNTSSSSVAAITPNITPEQLTQLKNNPALLKQFNITPAQLDSYITSQKEAEKKSAATGSQSPSLVQTLVKKQFETAIKPYESLVAPTIGLLLFISITSFSSLLGIFVSLLLWIIFSIMEKSGFVHFEKEMREVKKLVV